MKKWTMLLFLAYNYITPPSLITSAYAIEREVYIYPAKTCDQPNSQITWWGGLTRTHSYLTTANRRCDVNFDGLLRTGDLGSTNPAGVGWIPEEMVGYDSRVNHSLVYLLFELPDFSDPSIWAQVHEIALTLNTVQFIIGTEVGEPRLKLWISPSGVSPSELYSWNTTINGPFLPSVPNLGSAIEVLDLPLSDSSPQLEIDLTSVLLPLWLSGGGPQFIVFVLTVEPSDTFPGYSTLPAGFAMRTTGTGQEPALRFTYGIDEGPDPFWSHQFPSECGNLICEPGEFSTCPTDCQPDTQAPMIDIGIYTPIRCGQNSAPPHARNRKHNSISPIFARPSISSSTAIDHIQQHSPHDIQDVLTSCVHWIPPGTVQPQPLYSGSRYARFGRRFASAGYPLVLKVQDDRRLRLIEVEDLQSGKVLLSENFGWSGPAQWPQDSEVVCDQFTTTLFGRIIEIPVFCRVDYKELIVPLSEVCKNGRAHIRVNAVDLAGNTSTRSILFLPASGGENKPKIITADQDILTINHAGFQQAFSNGVIHFLRRPVLMSGDDLFFDFMVDSENSLKSVRVELQTMHEGHPPTVDVLYEENLNCPVCMPTDSACWQIRKRFRFQNLNKSLDSFRTSRQPSVLGDRTLFYNGIPQGNVRITLTDANGSRTIKDLPVVFLPNSNRRNWLKNITGKNLSRGTSSPTLLDQEGFFINFDNSKRADGDFKWWKSPFTSWSFIKTYFQTYYNSNGKKISWSNADKTEIVKKVAICAAAALNSYLGIFECGLANYLLWAPIYAKVLNKMSAWCTGFSIAFQMWRQGKIKWSDFSSCKYYKSGSYPPAPCDDTSRGSCYFECCRRRDEENKCTDSITENDLMLYLAGMQGKTMTGEFLNKYLDFARFKDDHLSGFTSLFFPGICNLPSSIKDSMPANLSFHNDFFKNWSPRERENWLVDNCQENPQRIILGSSILTMADSSTAKESHSIVPIRMQHTGDTDRIYVYDPNREYLSYGMRCLRPFQAGNPSDTVDFTLTSWINECGNYVEGNKTRFYSILMPSRQNALNWQDDVKVTNALGNVIYDPPTDLNGNYFRHIFNYLDLDVRKKKFVFDEYKKFAFVSTPHEYTRIPVSVSNLILELGDELGDWLNVLFDKKKVHSSANDPEIPTRLPLPGLPDDIQVLTYLHTAPATIQRTMLFPEGKSSFYYAQYGEYLGVYIEAEPKQSTRMTTAVKKDNRSITINSDSGIDSLQLKSMTFFPEPLQTIDGKFVYEENRKKVIRNYSYLMDAEIVSVAYSPWKLNISWDEEKNILVENEGEHSLEISATLHTSYLPYFPELKDMEELDQMVELFTKNKLPLEKPISFSVPGNSVIKISVDNWHKLSTSEVSMEDVSKPAKKKSNGCSTSGFQSQNTPLGFLFFMLILLASIKGARNTKRPSILLIVTFISLLMVAACDDNKTKSENVYGTNMELYDKQDYLNIDINDTSYRCLDIYSGAFGLIPVEITVFSEGESITLKIDQSNVADIISKKYNLNNFGFYVRYSNNPSEFPYKPARSTFMAKTQGWFDSQTIKEHRKKNRAFNISTTYLEIESSVSEISLGFEWESPVFGRFVKPEEIHVLEKK